MPGIDLVFAFAGLQGMIGHDERQHAIQLRWLVQTGNCPEHRFAADRAFQYLAADEDDAQFEGIIRRGPAWFSRIMEDRGGITAPARREGEQEDQA